MTIAMILAAFGSTVSFAAEVTKRPACPKTEQAPTQTQRQQAPRAESQPRKARPSGCPLTRAIPAVVDPTPFFLI
ncbi:hypothetical protein [Sphingomonas xanthus]|uniref:Secreted protein n=1 Tax=Sphingomonas xanthus TaxID=2594473 RepID=A0A516ITT3_9SPHN|nr:hypothetical protein [Sphingomonas xanthus]QDP20332.1 hypothetical protein FMM02_10435 [Sphingomonas xanthus]